MLGYKPVLKFLTHTTTVYCISAYVRNQSINQLLQEETQHQSKDSRLLVRFPKDDAKFWVIHLQIIIVVSTWWATEDGPELDEPCRIHYWTQCLKSPHSCQWRGTKTTMSRVAWCNNLEERLYKTSLPQLQTAITRARTRTWPMLGKKQTKLPIARASGDGMNECTLLPPPRSLFCSMIRPRPLGVPYF